MKPVHGDTVSNDGYSSTSCSYRSESGQTHQGTKNNLSRLFHEKYIPLRESKLLEKLVKTRALYEELRSQLLSSSLSNSGGSDSKPGKQHYESEKDVEETEKTNIIALVDLVDKGVILRPKKLNECRSCNNYMSRLTYSPKEHMHRKFQAHEYLTSKSSIISKHRADEESRLGKQFKTKNIKSEPCTCTFKYGEIIKQKPKDVLKQIHRDEMKKNIKECNKRISHKLKRSKAHYLDGGKLSVAKSIHSSGKEVEYMKTGTNQFFEKVNRHSTNSKSCYVPHVMQNKLISEARENVSEVKKNSNNKFSEKPKKNQYQTLDKEKLSRSDACNKNKHRMVFEKIHNQKKAVKQKGTSPDASIHSKIPKKIRSRYIIGPSQIKASKDNIGVFSQEQNKKLLKILAALLPKTSKKSLQLLSTNIATNKDKDLIMAKIKEITMTKVEKPIQVEKQTTRKKSICNLDGNKYRPEQRNFGSTRGNYLNEIANIQWQHKDSQQSYNFERKTLDSYSTSTNSIRNRGQTLKRCFYTSHPMNTSDLYHKTSDNIITDYEKSNVNLKVKSSKRNERTLRSSLFHPDTFVCARLECKTNNKEQAEALCKEKEISGTKILPKPLLASNNSPIILDESVQQSFLRYIALYGRRNKKYLNKSPSLKCSVKSKYIVPTYKFRRSMYTSKPGKKNIRNFTSPDCIAAVPNAYCFHKKGNYKLMKKYMKTPRRNKTLNEGQEIKFTDSYLSQFIQLAKSKNILSSLQTYKSNVLIKTYKQKKNYEDILIRQKHVSKTDKDKGSLEDHKSLRYDNNFHDTQLSLKEKHNQLNIRKSKPKHNDKASKWVFGPATNNCFYALQLQKNNRVYIGTTPNITKKDNSQKRTVSKSKTGIKTSLPCPNNLQLKVNRQNIDPPQGFGIQKAAKPELPIKSKSNTIRELQSNLKSDDKKLSKHRNLKDLGTLNIQKTKSKSKVYKLMTKAITKRASLSRNKEKCCKRSDITLKPNKHTSSLKLLKCDNPKLSELLTTGNINELKPLYIVNRDGIFESRTSTSQKLLSNHSKDFNSSVMRKYRNNTNKLYYKGQSTSSLLSVSAIAFKSEKSFYHEGQLNFFSSTDRNFSITSKETLEIKSKFSCEVNISKHISKRSCVRTKQSKKLPLILGRRELRHFENNGTIIYPSRIVRPIQVNHQLTGVASLLKRSFCAMNIQVGGRGEPKKIPYKLKDYECEPGVCVPDECNPYECQKLIVQRLMRQVSRIGTEKSASLASSFKSNSKTKRHKTNESHEEKRKIVRKKPRGLTYQTLPRQPQSEMQSYRRASRLGSSFGFDVEFSKNKSKAPRVKKKKEPIKAPKPLSKATHYKATDKHLKDRGHGTNKGATKRHRPSQSGMRKMYHRASTVTPMLKRCFCTLKLQKKGRQQKIRDVHTLGTSTPTKIKAPEKKVHKTREKGQTTNLKTKKNVLLPYECEPGICIPGECDPYECLEIIKKRNKHSKRTASVASDMSSSSSPPKRAPEKHTKLQRIKKSPPKDSYESTSSGTDVVEKVKKRQRRALEPYECEPGVCIPGECDPYECLKLIKKRLAKEKGTGPARVRHRTKSISSSVASSKTSKAGVAQSMLQTMPPPPPTLPPPSSPPLPPQEIVEHVHPSESVTFRGDESSQESTTRQAVRIGSTFSFEVEFYKDQQFPSYRRVQAASEAIRSTRRKMRKVDRAEAITPTKRKKRKVGRTEAITSTKRKKREVKKQSTETDTTSQHSRSSQMDGAGKAEKAIAPMLKRCFCTLKLQRKQKRGKQVKPIKQTKPKVIPPKHQGTTTPYNRPVPDLHDRSVMTAYKFKTYPYKLDPYECEPGVCIPGECDPYECLERIKRRHNMDRGSSTDNVETRSTINMTKPRRKYRDNKIQHATKERKEPKVRKVRPRGTKSESRVESRTIVVSSPSSSKQKQAVKIGSNFSFNVEFYKDRSRSGSTSSPKREVVREPRPERVRYEKPKPEKMRHRVSRTSQGISVSTRRKKMQNKRAVRDSDSQVLAHKMRSTMTGVGPFLKRCFCTLQLQKRGPKEPKPKTRKPDLESISVGTETAKYKPEIIHSVHKGTRTKKKYKFHGRTLEPYECEPGVCIPGECDPYECLERIKRREMHTKQSSTEPYRIHSVSSSAMDYKKSRPMRTQIRAPKERRVRTKRSHERYTSAKERPVKERPSVKERVTYEVSPSEQSHRQAVRIGSSFSFNIEFYKDRTRQVPTAPIEAPVTTVEERSEVVKYTKKPVRSTRSGAIARRSRSISSSYKHARMRGRGMQSQSRTYSRGSGGSPLLKRCFCTLKLQKIGKEQILSNTLLQTSPASIETTYRHAGTRVKKRAEAKRIAARETGTRPKRRRLEPYECEPGVCIPGECDPYECLERIKRRNKRHSGTGMSDTRTRSMSSLTSRTRTSRSMATGIVRRERREKRERKKPVSHTESQYKVKQPPRPSRAVENINIQNRQAVRLGSEFGFNIEFYKDRSSFKDRSRTVTPTCSPTVCKHPSCTTSKCKTSSCSSRCSYKNQGTLDSSDRHHRRLQAHANTESRGSSVKRLKRCFCTLTLQRAEVKTNMNSLRTTTLKINTQDRSTATKNKYFSQLLPYECEPGVCIPGECDPYECLERIKRRKGPYGPCDCLERRKARIRRVSRTTETAMRRTREVPARQMQPLTKRIQHTDSATIDNVVEEPRFKLFNNPYTRNTVKISSNFSFNIEFSRDISFPSTAVDSDENVESLYQADRPQRRRVHKTPKAIAKTQKPIALKNENTATEIFKRCFCTKNLPPIESVSKEGNIREPPFYRKCFCKNPFKSTRDVATTRPGTSIKEVSSKARDVKRDGSIASNIDPKKCSCRAQCQCRAQCKCAPKGKIKCLCGKGRKTKCLCPTKDVTVGRVEIDQFQPKLQNVYQRTTKSNAFTSANRAIYKLSDPGIVTNDSFCTMKLSESASNYRDSMTKTKKLLSCFGRHKFFNTTTKQNCSKSVSNMPSMGLLKKMIVTSKNNLSVKSPTSVSAVKLLNSKSEQRASKHVTSNNKSVLNTLKKLYSSRLTKAKSDQSVSNIAYIRSKSPDKINHEPCSIEVLNTKIDRRGSKSDSTAYLDGKRPLPLFKPNEYWVQYQIQRPISHKRSRGRNKGRSGLDHKQNQTKVMPPSGSLETLMCYCPTKFHKSTSKTQLYRRTSKVATDEVRLISISNRKPTIKCHCNTGLNDTCCAVCRKFKTKDDSLANQDVDKENIVYTRERFILEKNKVSIENIHSRSRNSQLNIKRGICNCFRIFKPKKNKFKNVKCACTQYQIKDTEQNEKLANRSTKKGKNRERISQPQTLCKQNEFENKQMEQKSQLQTLHKQNVPEKKQVEQKCKPQTLRKQNVLENKQLRYPKNKENDKNKINNIKNDKIAYINTNSFRCPVVTFQDKITFCDNKNTQSSTTQVDVTNCKSQNVQCPAIDFTKTIKICRSQNSQCPTANFQDKVTCCASQNSQGQTAKLNEKLKCKSQNSQCPSGRVHDKITFINLNTRSVTTDFHSNISCCKSKKSQFPQVGSHDKMISCMCMPRNFPTGDGQSKSSCCKSPIPKDMNKKPKHNKNKFSCTKKVKKSEQKVRHAPETKLIKVVKVTSDLKHLVCSNNAIYEIKDIVPPGACGDYKFAFVLESKDIGDDSKCLFNADMKDKKIPEMRFKDNKISCACIFYTKKNQKYNSKKHKISCPCLVCRKIVLPAKCSSDQKISYHMMEVSKVFDPSKINLPQKKYSKARKRSDLCVYLKDRNRSDLCVYFKGRNRSDLCVCFPKFKQKTCKCGTSICAKEIKGMVKKREDKALIKLQNKKKCVCGSAPCAAKLKKVKLKAKLAERKKLKKLLRKYKKADVKRIKKSKKINKLKNLDTEDALRTASKCILLIESLLDLKNITSSGAKTILRSGRRAIEHPKYAYESVKDMALHRNLIKDSKKTDGAFKRLRMRLGALTFVSKVKSVLESEPCLNYLLHIKDKRKRYRPTPLRLDERGCKLYLSSLREKPCFWVYYLWPWFYPHCINGLRMFKQLTDIILFLSAVVVWSPCLLGTELCRAMMCCLFCTG